MAAYSWDDCVTEHKTSSQTLSCITQLEWLFFSLIFLTSMTFLKNMLLVTVIYLAGFLSRTSCVLCLKSCPFPVLPDIGFTRYVCVLSHIWLFVTTWTIKPTRLLCPWDLPGKNTGVGCHFLLQGRFLTQESNPNLFSLLHWQMDSLLLGYLWSPYLI